MISCCFRRSVLFGAAALLLATTLTGVVSAQGIGFTTAVAVAGDGGGSLQRHPDICVTNEGRVFLAWEGFHSVDHNWDIYLGASHNLGLTWITGLPDQHYTDGGDNPIPVAAFEPHVTSDEDGRPWFCLTHPHMEVWRDLTAPGGGDGVGDDAAALLVSFPVPDPDGDTYAVTTWQYDAYIWQGERDTFGLMWQVRFNELLNFSRSYFDYLHPLADSSIFVNNDVGYGQWYYATSRPLTDANLIPYRSMGIAVERVQGRDRTFVVWDSLDNEMYGDYMANVLPLYGNTPHAICVRYGANRVLQSTPNDTPDLAGRSSFDDYAINAIIDGGNATCDSAAGDQDTAIFAAGAACPAGALLITAGDDRYLNSGPGGDDLLVAYEISLGRDGICETTAGGDDTQIIAPGAGTSWHIRPVYCKMWNRDNDWDILFNHSEKSLANWSTATEEQVNDEWFVQAFAPVLRARDMDGDDSSNVYAVWEDERNDQGDIYFDTWEDTGAQYSNVAAALAWLSTGDDGVADTAAAGDDLQVIPVGQGKPDTVAIAPGADDILNTAAGVGDDQRVQTTIEGVGYIYVITTGANGICETTAHGADVQEIPLTQGEPHTVAVQVVRADGTEAGTVVNDDKAVFDWAPGNYITTGWDGVCETNAAGDDEQAIVITQGEPYTFCVESGPNGILDTAVDVADSLLSGKISTGSDGICDSTAVGDDIQLIPVGQGQPHGLAVRIVGSWDTVPVGNDVGSAGSDTRVDHAPWGTIQDQSAMVLTDNWDLANNTWGADGLAEIYVVWRDDRNRTQQGYDVYFTRSRNNGVSWGVDDVITEPATAGNGTADTTAAGDDEQVIASGAAATAGAVIITPGPNGVLDTVPAGDDVNVPVDVRLNRDPVGSHADQKNPAIAVHPYTGALYAVWEDNRGSHQSIYYAESFDYGSTWGVDLDADGFVSPADNEYIDMQVDDSVSAVSTQADPAIVCDDSGNIYVTWSDSRSGSPRIYATRRTSPQPPTAPVNLVVTGYDENYVALAWDALDTTNPRNQDLAYYTVYRSTDNVTYTSLGNTTLTTWTDGTVTAGTTYYYTVSATDNAANESLMSVPFIIKPIDPGGTPDTTPPAVPTGLQALAGPGQVTLTWTPNADDAAQYWIYRRDTAGGTPIFVGLADVPSVVYVDYTVVNGRSYWYQISAVDLFLNESALTAVVGPVTPTVGGLPTAPGPVQGFQIADSGGGYVLLQWTGSPEVDVDYYNIYRSTFLPLSTIVPLVSVDKTQAAGGVETYMDLSVSNGITYYYAITAVNTSGQESPVRPGGTDPPVYATPTVSADPQAPPPPFLRGTVSGLAAQTRNYGTSIQYRIKDMEVIAMTWDHSNATDVQHYFVYKRMGEWGAWQFDVADPIDDGLTLEYGPGGIVTNIHVDASNNIDLVLHGPNKMYYYVTAVDTSGRESAPSNIIGADPVWHHDSTPPRRPGGLKAEASNGQATVHWDKPIDNDVIGHNVYVYAGSTRPTDSLVSGQHLTDGAPIVPPFYHYTVTSTTVFTTGDEQSGVLTNNQHYWIGVTAVDAFENESAPSWVGVVPSVYAEEGGGGGGGCFVATAAYGSPMAQQVRELSLFRDDYLMDDPFGRYLVSLYYTHGPRAAAWLQGRDAARAAVRLGLAPVIEAVGAGEGPAR